MQPQTPRRLVQREQRGRQKLVLLAQRGPLPVQVPLASEVRLRPGCQCFLVESAGLQVLPPRPLVAWLVLWRARLSATSSVLNMVSIGARLR